MKGKGESPKPKTSQPDQCHRFDSPLCVLGVLSTRWWTSPSGSQMFQSGLKGLGSTTLRTCSNTQTRTKWLSTLQVSDMALIRVIISDKSKSGAPVSCILVVLFLCMHARTHTHTQILNIKHRILLPEHTFKHCVMQNQFFFSVCFLLLAYVLIIG